MNRALVVLVFAPFLAAACGSSSSSSTAKDAGSHDSAKSGHDAKSGDDAKVTKDSGLGPGECRSQSDCGSGAGEGCLHYTYPAICSAKDAGTSVPAGIMCESASDCADAGANAVCGSLCYLFTGGEEALTCSPGCTADSDCAPARVCNAAHSCEAAPCTMASDCGANYTCTSGACAEKPCTEDSECEGFCVESYDGWRALTGAKTCSPTLGTCTPYTA